MLLLPVPCTKAPSPLQESRLLLYRLLPGFEAFGIHGTFFVLFQKLYPLSPILKNLPYLKKKGFPLLVGLSRKSFLGVYTGLPPQNRIVPTVAANAIAILLGADIIRVHDVQEASETVKIVDAIKQS